MSVISCAGQASATATASSTFCDWSGFIVRSFSHSSSAIPFLPAFTNPEIFMRSNIAMSAVRERVTNQQMTFSDLIQNEPVNP